MRCAAIIMLVFLAACTSITVIGTHNAVSVQKGSRNTDEVKMKPKVKTNVGNPHK